MTTTCLVVLTARGIDRIKSDGGSQAWRLNRDNAKRTRFCVCVQNRHNGSWGGADQEHHHAFMVGRIKDVTSSPERPERFIVEFSEYALVDSPNAWPSGNRNPVSYRTLEDFGITTPEALEWSPMPTEDPPRGGRSVAPEAMPDEEQDSVGPLTIPEARAGLALGLGVPEGAIEITVRY